MNDISKEFTDMNRVNALAAFLLEGVGQGGTSFVESKMLPGQRIDVQKLTRDVLFEWKRKSSTATLDKLYHVLNHMFVLPSAALKFKQQLLESS